MPQHHLCVSEHWIFETVITHVASAMDHVNKNSVKILKGAPESMEFPDRVTIQIKLSGSDCYVYSIKASNGTFSVIMEGNINTGSGGKYLANIQVP